MIETILKLPLLLFGIAWNGAVAVLYGVFNLLIVLVQTLAPYATLGLLFVSNEDQAAPMLAARARPAVATPADGELFSRLFEETAGPQKAFMKDGTLVVVDESLNRGGGLMVNVYRVESREDR